MAGMAKAKWLLLLAAVGCLELSVAADGCNWTEDTSVGATKAWKSVAMSDNGEYQTAVSDHGAIWRSTDYGANWTAVASTNGHRWKYVAMSDDGEFQTAVELLDTVWTSEDHGAFWTERTLSSGPNSLQLVAMSGNGTVQMAGSTDTTDPNGHLRRHIWISTNAGADWTLISTATTRDFKAGDVSDNGEKQVLVSSTGYILISENTGSTWSQQRPTTTGLHGVTMSDSGQHITAVGLTGVILVSNDGGGNWSDETVSDANLNDVAMSGDGQIQTTVDNGGKVWSSSDYGETWANTETLESKAFEGVAMSGDGTRQTAVALSGNIWTCNAKSSTPDEPSTPDAPVTPTTEPPAPPPSDSATLGAGAIAGIAVGSVAVVGIGVYAGFS